MPNTQARKEKTRNDSMFGPLIIKTLRQKVGLKIPQLQAVVAEFPADRINTKYLIAYQIRSFIY